MNTKLTLSIEKRIITRAKDYAKRSNRSLSDIIQSYLETITANHTSTDELDEELLSIKGAITLPDDFNLKNEIRSNRLEKFSDK